MNKLRPEFFKRMDDRPDQLFYAEPRRVNHIDAGALHQLRKLYKELLPVGGNVLDLMASYHSHLPEDIGHVMGLGLNKTELLENEQIDKTVVQDLNLAPKLPFPEDHFCGAVCSVSVQYMTQPDALFPEIVRVLNPGAPFIVSFSKRMFPTKAILAWRASDDAAHIRLVKSYFANAKGFGATETRTYKPDYGDPLYAVWAYKHSQAIAQLN